jgi:hypothetical protein
MADRPLATELHDTYCRSGDWPHAGECVAFEGYEVAANPLLTVLAGRGYARRADVPEVQAAPVIDRDRVADAIGCEIGPYISPPVNYYVLKATDAVMALLNGGAK